MLTNAPCRKEKRSIWLCFNEVFCCHSSKVTETHRESTAVRQALVRSQWSTKSDLSNQCAYQAVMFTNKYLSVFSSEEMQPFSSLLNVSVCFPLVLFQWLLRLWSADTRNFFADSYVQTLVLLWFEDRQEAFLASVFWRKGAGVNKAQGFWPCSCILVASLFVPSLLLKLCSPPKLGGKWFQPLLK